LELCYKPASNQASVVEPADGATVYGESVEIEAEYLIQMEIVLMLNFFSTMYQIFQVLKRTVSERQQWRINVSYLDNINKLDLTHRWWVKTSDSWESTKGGSWTFYNIELPSVSNPSPLMMVS